MTGHGSSKLTPEGTAANEKLFGVRYLHIADGSQGGPNPARRYGVGGMATSIKTKRR